MTKPDVEELDNVNPEPTPEAEAEQVEELDEIWDKRSSKVSLAYPIQRDLEVVGPADECIDCRKAGKPGRRDHQFHIRASRAADGEFRGPEAEHLRFLREGGYLKNTPQARERSEAQANIDRIRGIFAEPACRSCGTAIPRNAKGELAGICPNCNTRNGLPELAARTTEQVRKLWARDLRGGPEKAMENELALRRADVEELRKSVQTLGEGIGEAIREGIKEGIAAVKDARR